MRISDWSSDVCSSDLLAVARRNDGELVADTGGTSVRRVDVGCDLLVGKESHILVAMGFAREYGPRLHLGIGDHDVLPPPVPGFISRARRSEEHTSELQSLMRISYAVFCLKTNNCNILQT